MGVSVGIRGVMCVRPRGLSGNGTDGRGDESERESLLAGGMVDAGKGDS